MNQNSNRQDKEPVALLWDESFLWGVMAVRALKKAALPFKLIRSEDIKKGALSNYRMLFVPGGWASNKMKTLGEDGAGAIRSFVSSGGSYLGLCGGAGLATQDGIGIINISRMPTRERVPSFSGRIRLRTDDHKIWNGLKDKVVHAWWPSQFVVGDGSVKTLATYVEAMPDAFSSDINVGDITSSEEWEKLETLYDINLNPSRLFGQPAVVESAYGSGKVLLSLVHFDSPDDENGLVMLKNLWQYLAGAEPSVSQKHAETKSPLAPQRQSDISRLEAITKHIIEFGERNFLWFWRNPMLLQWRRGVRGLEYCTLYMLLKECAAVSEDRNPVSTTQAERMTKLRGLLIPFVKDAKNLLFKERIAMQQGHITYEKCSDPEIQALRNDLFSSSKSYGGRFKELLDEIDALLFELIKKSYD
ncbi:MAG: hypothetical protein EPN22_06190 [Nitrospirae bacterium]|nr:MAG: hypothetical protein EPN22_06190 [Nitrospirota bacterium]